MLMLNFFLALCNFFKITLFNLFFSPFFMNNIIRKPICLNPFSSLFFTQCSNTFSIYFLAYFLIFFWCSFSQKTFSQTPNNLNGWFPDREVTAMSSDNDYIYLGGEFTSFVKKGQGLRSAVGIINHVDKKIKPLWDTHWASFGSVVDDGKGGWYVSTYLDFDENNPNDKENHKIIHINSDYTIDPNWSINIDANKLNNMTAMALHGNYLYVGGHYLIASNHNIIRISTITGEIDRNWGKNIAMYNDNTMERINQMIISNNHIVVAGDFERVTTGESGNSSNAISIKNICRISLETGLLDRNWNLNANAQITNMVLNNEDLYILGSFSQIGGVTLAQSGIAKININTNIVDIQWVPVLDGWINVIKILDNNIYIGGSFRKVNGVNRTHIAKLSKQGVLDINWDLKIDYTADASSYYYGYQVSSNVNTMSLIGNDLYVGGNIRSVNGQPSANACKFSFNTGAVDNTWNVKTNDKVTQILPWKDGILVTGWFRQIGCEYRQGLARIKKSNMELDEVWQPKISSESYILSLSVSSNYLYVAGAFSEINGVPRKNLAKISTADNGSLDMSWNLTMPEYSHIEHIITTPTDVYVAGRFTEIGGKSRKNIAKISHDGIIDDNWNTNLESSEITRMALAGNNLYVSGTLIRGGYYKALMKIQANGTGNADFSWIPDVGVQYSDREKINVLTINGEYLYVGGNIESINDNKGYNSLVRYKIATGELDTSWKPDAKGVIRSVLFDGDFMYVMGAFQIPTSTSKYQAQIKKYDHTTATLLDWKVNVLERGGTFRFGMVKNANSLILTGYFYKVDTYNTPYIASLNLYDTPSNNDYFANSIKAYPNPAQDIINIAIADAQYSSFKIKLLDINGKIIQEIEGVSQPEGFKMDVSKLRAGMYLLHIESKNAKTIKRVIKL